MIEIVVFVALLGATAVGVTLAAYPLVKLALKYAEPQPSEAVVDAVTKGVEAQQVQVLLKERYVEKPAVESVFRVVGDYVETTWGGKNYRAPRSGAALFYKWAEYPSGMADSAAGIRIVELWEAEKRRKEWGT